MGSPCPPHWTVAARAAYFGDRICAFCEHRNPAGARFCNGCASPLHLKPCRQCDAVNEQAAVTCHHCGAVCPVPGTTGAVRVLPTDEVASAALPREAVDAASPQPLVAAGPSRVGWRLPVAALATIVIVGAYDVYRAKVSTPAAVEVVSPPVGVPHDEPTAATPVGVPQDEGTAATPAVPMVAESIPDDLEGPADATVTVAVTGSADAPRATVRERPSAPRTIRTSAHRRPLAPGQAPAGATRRPASAPVSTRVATRAAQGNDTPRLDRWQVMHASLARCGGDLIARILCEQRVRLRFCDGHWGAVPHCASGITNEHGQ